MKGQAQTEEQIQRVYRREARFNLYDPLTWVTFLGQSDKLRRRMVFRMELVPGDRVLDIGCGTGLNLEAIRDKVGAEGEIDGIDLTPEMLGLAQRRVERKRWNSVRVSQGDARSLPFADDVFDGVCSTLALSVVADWRLALKEAWRVLKPGGRISLLDASALRGGWKRVAPIVQPIYKKFAAWQPEVELDKGLEEIGANCEVERPLGGLYYIAWARKPVDAYA